MTKSIRKKYKYKSKKRRNKKTKRLKNRKSKATNKYASHKGGAWPVVAAAAAIGAGVGAGAIAYTSSRGVEGDLGKIIKKFHLYKKKYFSLNSLRVCILYVVNHGGKYRFYFDKKNKKAKKNVGQQLTDGDVGGSSPPGGNIFGWSFSPSFGRIEGKDVPAVIKLSPHEDKVKLSRTMRIPEYTGFDKGNYEVPIIFGINTHTAYIGKTPPEITVINKELIYYLNKGITGEDCNEPEQESMGVESESMDVEPKTTMERARAGTGISLDNELIKNRELIYSKIEKKEEGNVRLRELIDKINKNEATGPEIAEKDKLEVDLNEMGAEIIKLKGELRWEK